jgi:cobyrinic acid a,c-diamide synthase
MTARGVIVAAPASGSGKTLITLGLLRALKDRGLRLAGAKAGPDYIDPGFHRAASGRYSANLDVWAMRPATLGHTLAGLEQDAELIVAEGVMGLFDGIGAKGLGSTADLAERLGWPVVLVVDARGASASVAATLRGFANHRPGITVAGVIANRVGSANHASVIEQACRAACPDVAWLGALPRDAELALPERHLGLVQAIEHPALERFIAYAAVLAARHLDLDRLIALAQAGHDLPRSDEPALPPLGQRIALACDAAFQFHYRSVLDGWRDAGAEIAPFSPLLDEPPHDDADAVYLPGGYPELHAAHLAQAEKYRAGMLAAARRGAAIYGECGGYMALGQALIDGEGQRYPMLGLLPLVTSFADRKLSLGYRQASLRADGVLGTAGSGFRGHEFHYAQTCEQGDAPALFDLADAEGRALGPAGLAVGRVAGSFMHLIDRA